METGETAPFLDGFARLKIPLLDESGASVWPERFDAARIEAVRNTLITQAVSMPMTAALVLGVSPEGAIMVNTVGLEAAHLDAMRSRLQTILRSLDTETTLQATPFKKRLDA